MLWTRSSKPSLAAAKDASDEKAAGATSFPPGSGDIFEQRKQKQLTQVAELGDRMAALGRALEETRREVALDPLTRLYNRKTFDEELERAGDMSGLFGQPACLLLVDADHFKGVNDRHGHPAG